MSARAGVDKFTSFPPFPASIGDSFPRFQRFGDLAEDSFAHTLPALPHNPCHRPRGNPGPDRGSGEGGGVRVGRATVARFSEAIAKTRASATVRLVGAKNAGPSPPSRR